MSNFIVRVISAIILAVITITGVLYLPTFLFKLFVALLVGIVCYEVVNLFKHKINELNPVISAFVGIFSAISLLFLSEYLAILIIFLYSFYIANKLWNLEVLAYLIFSFVYGVFFLSTLGFLFEINKYILFVLFATVWAGDTFAYIVGKTIGKHQLAPRLSPKKTIEGFIGSIVGSVLFGYSIAKFLSIEDSIIVILIASVVMQFGDLFESFIKRQVNVKDSSNLIPGHGGILDRIDALVFASVVFYIWYSL